METNDRESEFWSDPSYDFDIYFGYHTPSTPTTLKKSKNCFLDLDPEEEAMKPGANEVLWAVVAAYTK